MSTSERVATAALIVSLLSFIVSLCALINNILVARRDRIVLVVTCSFFSITERGPVVALKIANHGRRSASVAIMHWYSGGHLTEEGSVRLGEHESVVVPIALEHVLRDFEGNVAELIDVWFVDDLDKEYRARNTVDDIEQLLSLHRKQASPLKFEVPIWGSLRRDRD
ncbi:hypothetical protein FHW12_003145 [Dokdonella fugitiva]|uniref:Uncharacterized protein n=1 Tax=Dokdonella fugitiva TaxID=328517 RepID=A0A839F521_9GAMM|nr:hypothetical protein [Dokdonella fugitiva]MBA8888909.1 hypothetical protein [Dokdonella fugitiva]